MHLQAADDGPSLRTRVKMRLGRRPANQRSAASGLLTRAAEALNHASETFAGRRMDASIQKALAGQKIDELKV